MRGLPCIALLLLSTIPAAGQTGRAGATWQTEIDLAKEARAAFLLENERLSDAEWEESALATVRFNLADAALTLRELARLQDAVGDNKAVTEKAGGVPEEDDAEGDDVEDYFGLSLGSEGPAQEEVWTVRFAKKPPRNLTLTLTDKDSTKVKCSMKELETVGSGVLGIFQNEVELLCIPRGTGDSG